MLSSLASLSLLLLSTSTLLVEAAGPHQARGGLSSKHRRAAHAKRLPSLPLDLQGRQLPGTVQIRKRSDGSAKCKVRPSSSSSALASSTYPTSSAGGQSSVVQVQSSTSSSAAAPTSTTAAWVAPTTTTTAEWVAPTTTTKVSFFPPPFFLPVPFEGKGEPSNSQGLKEKGLRVWSKDASEQGIEFDRFAPFFSSLLTLHSPLSLVLLLLMTMDVPGCYHDHHRCWIHLDHHSLLWAVLVEGRSRWNGFPSLVEHQARMVVRLVSLREGFGRRRGKEGGRE